ncbi:MAG: hypothetical protein CL760_06125 [Chloroflexi bacterium]|nr:hypothetical protein [Chloroflexota bacterium]
MLNKILATLTLFCLIFLGINYYQQNKNLYKLKKTFPIHKSAEKKCDFIINYGEALIESLMGDESVSDIKAALKKDYKNPELLVKDIDISYYKLKSFVFDNIERAKNEIKSPKFQYQMKQYDIEKEKNKIYYNFLTECRKFIKKEAV